MSNFIDPVLNRRCRATPSVEFTIEKMTAADWPEVRAIYLTGIATGHASFELDAPTWEIWDAKHLPDFRFVARNAEDVCGWTALSPVSQRRAYAGVAELSIYVAPESQCRGIGHALLVAIIARSEEGGIWTLQSSVFPENAASVRLHLKCGFREVGRRERLGKRDGAWRNVLLLERRSKVAGVD